MEKIIVWLKENWFKVGLITVIIIAIFIYLFSWQPAQEKKEILVNNIKCQQEGAQLYELEKKSLLRGEIAGDPEFKFSKELNTCLLKGRIIGADDTASYLRVFIKDVYSNEELAGYTSFTIKGQQPDLHGDKEKYEALNELYFSK